MATEREVASIVAIIGAAYPNFNATEMTIEVYFRTLSDLDFELLKTAALHAIAEPGRKFAPSVGELRGAVSEILQRASGMPSSFEAWEEFLQQVRAVGHTGIPQFSHPLVTKTVRVLGWRDLCLSENQVADRARFVQAYEQFVERANRDMSMLPTVSGYIETKASTQIKMLADKLSGGRNVR